MSSVVIGTIDLTALCGCGSDCADCCGHTVPCCVTSIPDTVYASLSGGSCSCPALPTVTMTYNSGTSKWEGSGVCSGADTITVKLYCDTGTLTWRFDITIVKGGGTCLGATNVTADSAVCSPLSIVKTINVAGCCGGVPTLMTITVTS